MVSSVFRWTWKSLCLLGVVLAVLAGTVYVALNWERLTVWPEKRTALLRGLKDPQSAVFQDEYRRGPYLCGFVNAKSGMGGYVGFGRFISFEHGYALDGNELTGWPADHEAIKDQLALMKAKIHWLQTIQQPVDQDQEWRLVFDRLWEKTCRSQNVATK